METIFVLFLVLGSIGGLISYPLLYLYFRNKHDISDVSTDAEYSMDVARSAYDVATRNHKCIRFLADMEGVDLPPTEKVVSDDTDN